MFLKLAVFEKQQGGDGADVEFLRELGVVVHVHLADLHLGAEFGGEIFENGGDGFAGAAPGGPKIHKDGLAGRLYGGVEGGGVEGEDFFGGHGGKCEDGRRVAAKFYEEK